MARSNYHKPRKNRDNNSSTDYKKKNFAKKNSKFKSNDDKKKHIITKEDKEQSKKDFFTKPKVERSTNKKIRKIQVIKSTDNTIRLNRYIANSGVCSRREADKLIEAGDISINGEVVTVLSTKVSIDDDVRLKTKKLNPEKKVYLLLNKPKGYVTTLEDKHASKTVMDLVGDACFERIYPVGRLDKDTTGVLLFTNDGDLTKKLTHPSHKKKKIYHVFLDKNFKKNDLEVLVEGFDLEDGFIAVDAIQYIDTSDKTQIGVEIHSGKNRIVRRMFEHLGYEVIKLDRVYFAGLTKKNLPRGKRRFLTEKEIGILKMGSYN